MLLFLSKEMRVDAESFENLLEWTFFHEETRQPPMSFCRMEKLPRSSCRFEEATRYVRKWQSHFVFADVQGWTGDSRQAPLVAAASNESLLRTKNETEKSLSALALGAEHVHELRDLQSLAFQQAEEIAPKRTLRNAGCRPKTQRSGTRNIEKELLPQTILRTAHQTTPPHPKTKRLTWMSREASRVTPRLSSSSALEANHMAVGGTGGSA